MLNNNQKMNKKRKLSSSSRTFTSSSRNFFSSSFLSENLPIVSYKEEILSSLERYQTLILIGETGSGKSTKLIQFLNEKLITNQCIVCTQPRRIATITIAERVAREQGCQIGNEVGYSIRFNDCTSHLTRMKYVTDGVLLREIMTDINLDKYEIVILDEAHERSLQTDILMGLLKQLQQRRSSLKYSSFSSSFSSSSFSCSYSHSSSSCSSQCFFF